MGLTNQQRRQLEKQIIDHEDYYRKPTTLRFELTADEILQLDVMTGVMLPDRMTSRILAEYLYDNKDLYEKKIVLDMGCGSGIQGIVMAKHGAEQVIFSDLCNRDGHQICFKDNAQKNAEKNIVDFQEKASKLIFREGNLFDGLSDFQKIDVIVFNHPFFPADPSKEYQNVLVAYSMLDSGELIHDFFKKASKFNPDLIIMPYFHQAGPVNDPGIQALVEGFVPIEVLSIDVDAGLQNGKVSIYQLKPVKSAGDRTIYKEVKKVINEQDKLSDVLGNPNLIKKWSEPIPNDCEKEVKKLLVHRAILKTDWGEVFDEYDDEVKRTLFHHIVFSPLAREIDRLLTNSDQHAFLFVYYTEEGKRVPSVFYDCNGEENEELTKIYEEFKRKVIEQNNFDLTREILHELQDPSSVSFGIKFSTAQTPSIKESNTGAEVSHFIETLVSIEFGEDLAVPDIKEINDDKTPTLKRFVDSRANKEFGKDFGKIFCEVYLKEMENFLKRYKYIYLLPIHIDIAKSPISVGSIIICSNSEIEKLDSVIHTVSDFLTPIRLSEFNSQVFKHSLQSAVGTIMARNMSHNIGSHVLTTVSTDYTLDSIHIKNGKSLYRYLQNRMDFIAQISTEFPRWTYPVWFVKQMMKEFCSQIHLLNYIAISEGLYYKLMTELSPQSKKPLRINLRWNNEPVNLDDPTKDSLVAIPGGVVGHHAMFVILEDIIRNSAKHNFALQAGQSLEELIVTVNIIDNLKNDFVRFEIWDSASVITNDDCKNDLPLDCSNKNISLHQLMNCKIINGFLDSEGVLRKEDWGIGEMKICAGYLQRQPVKRIGGHGRENLQILKAIAKYDNGTYRLGYSFDVPKPKELLIVTKAITANPLEFRRYGIYIESKIPEDRNFEFMIVDLSEFSDDTERDEIENKLVNEIESLPCRLFVIGENINVKKLKRMPIPSEETIKLFRQFLNPSAEKHEELKLRLYGDWLRYLWSQYHKNSTKDDKVKLCVKVLGQEGIKSELNTVLDELVHQLNIAQAERGEKDPLILNALELLGLGEFESRQTTAMRELLSVINLPEYLSSFISPILPRSADTVEADPVQIAYIRHKGSMNGNLYFESLSGNAMHFSLLETEYTDSEYLKQKLICQLVENGLLRIGIADERVCNYAGRNNEAKNSLRLASVFLIDKIKNWQNIREKYEVELLDDGKLKHSNNHPHKKIDVLIIHQGIIDKITPELTENEKITVEEWIERLKEGIPYIFVTSGRGRPHNVPKNAKYIPFSTIESFVLSRPHHKFLLTQSLMNVVD